MHIDRLKTAATALRRELAARGLELSHMEALELVARQFGFRDWNTAAARTERGGDATLLGNVPVLRVMDGRAAIDFYSARLGFAVEFEHRFDAGAPLYVRMRRDQAALDLSEHYGDGTPGGVVWVPVRGVRALHRELVPLLAPQQRPGIDVEAPGGPTFEVIDPFGNVLRFAEVGPAVD